MSKSMLLFTCIFLSLSAHASNTQYEALTVPEKIRVTSSEPRKGVWNGLSRKEKKLATHLLAAANAGKNILIHQNHRHGLLIKKVLETSLNQTNLGMTKALLADAF